MFGVGSSGSLYVSVITLLHLFTAKIPIEIQWDCSQFWNDTTMTCTIRYPCCGSLLYVQHALEVRLNREEEDKNVRYNLICFVAALKRGGCAIVESKVWGEKILSETKQFKVKRHCTPIFQGTKTKIQNDVIAYWEYMWARVFSLRFIRIYCVHVFISGYWPRTIIHTLTRFYHLAVCQSNENREKYDKEQLTTM